jgi:glucose-1-phosphate adenylyltransferase
MGWNFFRSERNESFDILPASQRISEKNWYLGTADAVYQNIDIVEAHDARFIVLLAGDHIYKMDYGEMMACHRSNQADITIATLQVPPADAGRLGVLEIGEDYRVIGFEEKPQHDHPARSRFDPSMVSASMGVYIFNTGVLLRALHEDSQDPNSSHDFGRDVIPRYLDRCRVVAYDFRDINAKQSRYWRDVGTLDAYYDANMDLVSVTPEFNLYDQHWPIRTRATQQPPAKFVFAQKGRRMGLALDSIVSAGSIVSGGRVVHSVLSPGVRVNSYCEVEYAILMPGVEIGRYSRIRKAIINTGVKIPELHSIGFDPDADRARGYNVTEGGVTVVGD